MSEFFVNPFLPVRKVNTVIIDGRADMKIIDALNSMDIETILTPQSDDLYNAICGHPDILLHPVTENKIIVNPDINEEFIVMLKTKGFIIQKGGSVLSCNYPKDIAYNVARVGNFAFHNLKYTDKTLKNELERLGTQFINVNQGYTKCSTAIVAENAIITSDKGIQKAAQTCKIDVLLIGSGNIDLPGINYGFIGGACGLISNDILAFTGKFTHDETYQKVHLFLQKYNVKEVFLTKEKMFDIGSIIAIS